MVWSSVTVHHQIVQKMVELANDGPTISRANIAHACGTCLLKLGLGCFALRSYTKGWLWQNSLSL